MRDEHPVLGVIRSSEKNPNGVEAEVLFSGRSIPLRIDPDDQSLDDAIAFASEVVTSLTRLESESMQIAVRDLCPTYNNGWNEFDEVQADGSTKTVRNPQLSNEEFRSKLTLSEIGITGNECIEFWYDDSNLFWGHGVLVSALDRLDLTNARGELFG